MKSDPSQSADARPADMSVSGPSGMDMMGMMGKTMTPPMMPVMAKMTCHMTDEGMVIELVPSMGATLETMAKGMERIRMMTSMGVPLVMTGMGMPMIVCRSK